jgi:hypothetical protein
MPALPNVPLTIRIKLIGNDGADANVQNAWYFTYTGTAAATDLNTLMGIVVSSWSANIAPNTSNAFHLTGVEITDLNSKTGAKVFETVSVAGTVVSTELSSGAAVVVRGAEGDRYRGGHRRVYLSGRTTSELQDPNTWTVAFQTAIASGVQAFVNQIISAAPAALGALKDVVVHRYGASANAPVKMDGYTVKLKSVPLTTPITHPISGYSTNPQVASQRRRNQQTA